MKILRETIPDFLGKYHKLLAILAFIVILGAGFYVRIDNIKVWQTYPERFFFDDNTPILLTVDGYFYLGLARDLLEGTYEKTDTNRAVPQGLKRPWPAPLLSCITAFVAKITPYKLEWIALILPTILGLSLAFPMYGLGRYFGNVGTGLIAAFFALFSRHYVIRNTLGWYDTDILNVSFIMASCFLFLKFGVETGRRRYYYFGAGIVVYFLTAWWWDQAFTVVTVATLIPMFVALIFYYRPPRKEAKIFLTILGCSVLPLILLKGNSLFWGVLGLLKYIIKEQISIFPTMGNDVAEQQGASLDMIIEYTIGSEAGLWLSLLGLAMLIYRFRTKVLFIFFPLVVALMSYSARRFLIFVAPVSALGIAFLLYELWILRKKQYLFVLAPFIIFPLLAWPNIQKVQEDNRIHPVRSPFHFQAFSYLSKIAGDQEFVTWTDWGHGYPLEYYSRGGTIADGQHHSGDLLYIVSIPMATSSFRMAANWMQFYVKHGNAGYQTFEKFFDGDKPRSFHTLQKIFQVGPEGSGPILNSMGISDAKEITRWLEFLFPPATRTIYFLLDIEKIRTAWFYYGTWDFSATRGQNALLVPFNNVQEMFGRLRGNGLELDTQKGVAYYNRQPFPLRTLARFDGQKWQVNEFDKKNHFIFDLNQTTRSGVLMDINAARSVAANLFARHNFDPNYFKPVLLKTPYFQIWQVKGDRFSAPIAD